MMNKNCCVFVYTYTFGPVLTVKNQVIIFKAADTFHFNI